MPEDLIQSQELSDNASLRIPPTQEQQVVLYIAADGKVTARVLFLQDNFWMTQKTIAELFGVQVPAISKHLKNIYAIQELNQDTTVSKMETVPYKFIPYIY